MADNPHGEMVLVHLDPVTLARYRRIRTVTDDPGEAVAPDGANRIFARRGKDARRPTGANVKRTDRVYRAWTNMRLRCRERKHYAGRITICARWDRFENFEKDMPPHPGKGWSLDRKKNHLGYSKGNCRWATAEMQNRNRRLSPRSGKLTMKKALVIRRLAKTTPYTVLAARYGVDPSMVSAIVRETTWY